jgi:hypothetical protein
MFVYELGRTWKDPGAAYFKIMLKNIAGESEENYGKLSWGLLPRNVKIKI